MKGDNGLHFTDVGKGEVAIVFLHYFGGSSNSWFKVIAELIHKFRCIAVDLPGFGDSQGASKKLSVSDCAKDVAQLIKVLALKQYVLVGHSMGGKIALSLASMQPFGPTSLILIAPSPPTPEPIEAKERKQLLNSYGDRFALETLLNNVTAKPLVNSDMKNAVSDNLRASNASWNWWIELGSQENISAQVSTVRVHVLIISGEADPKFSTSFLREEMLTYFPLASFAEIKNAGHLLPIETPLDIAKAIDKFIVKHDKSSRL